MKKSLIITGLTLATIGAIGSTTLASDARGPAEPNELSAKIAAAFNLEQSAVQKVIDQYRNDQQQSRFQTMVDNGRLTAEQKTLIENKMDELQPQLDAIRDLADDTARHEAMSKIQGEIKSWEDENDVRLPLHMGMRGAGHGKRIGQNGQ